MNTPYCFGSFTRERRGSAWEHCQLIDIEVALRPDKEMAKIYISSTFKDLAAYREAVYRALRQLRHDVIAMEDYVAIDERPLDKCLADVTASDIYVGIFAWRYGYIPAERNPTQCSITELEYRRAVETGRPRLIFLLSNEAAWPTPLLDAITGDGERGQRIIQLRTELGGERLASFFTTPDELARLVSIAVQQQTGRTLVEFERFAQHMRRFAGATSEEDAVERYAPLLLQVIREKPVGDSGVQGETRVGTWQELVTYPTFQLVVGEPGSGKTTTILFEVQRLAREAQARPHAALPVYLKLTGSIGQDGQDLLRRAAQSISMSYAEFQDLWEQERRPICLFLDGAEEVGDAERLVGAIRALFGNETPVFHSLVISCRAGAPFLERAARDLTLSSAVILSLGNPQIDEFLDCYQAKLLKQELSSGMREVLNKPDLLSALAQAAPEIPAEGLPRSRGGIYQLLIERLFRQGASEYDYDRIKKPVLAQLAYQLVASKQESVALDDALYDRVAESLELLQARYQHRRHLMPFDWTAEGLFDEMIASSVLEDVFDQPGALAFSQRLYRDFFAACYLGLSSERVTALSETVARDLYSWTEPLAILLGIEPSAAVNILNTPALAAHPTVGQVWLENRPEGIPAPSSMVQPSSELTAEVSAYRPSSKWATGDARSRFLELQAACAQGSAASGLLLNLAQDEHPLVRGVAQYALLHAGETLDPNSVDDPAPLLLDVSPIGQLRFSSWGGGDIHIGSLDLLRLPIPGDVMVKAAIETIDFDPFEAPAEFRFLHVSPGHFAARFFDGVQQVDWLALLARFRRIAVLAANVAQRAEPLQHLQPLVPELWARATSYDHIGRLLARDFGLAWPPVDLGRVSQGGELIEETYRQLRKLYSRVNQRRTFQVAQPMGESTAIAVDQIVGLIDRGAFTGITVESMEIIDEESEHLVASKLFSLVFTQSFENAAGGMLTGIAVERMAGASRFLPLKGRISGTIRVKRLQNSMFDGLAVEQLSGRSLGIRVDLAIALEEVVASFVGGVTVKMYLADETS